MKALALVTLALVSLNVSAQSFTAPTDCLAAVRGVAIGTIDARKPLILPMGRDSMILNYNGAELVSGLDLSNWNTTVTVTSKGATGKNEPRSVGLNSNGTASYLDEAPKPDNKKFESTPVQAGDLRIAEALKGELARVGSSLSDSQKGRIYEVCRAMPEVTAGLSDEWRNSQPRRPVADTDGIFGRDGVNLKRDTLRRVDEIMREPSRPRGSIGEGFFGPKSNASGSGTDATR